MFPSKILNSRTQRENKSDEEDEEEEGLRSRALTERERGEIRVCDLCLQSNTLTQGPLILDGELNPT